MWSSPGFTAVAIAPGASIGISPAIFTVVNGVILARCLLFFRHRSDFFDYFFSEKKRPDGGARI
jgi:hypothetical protein